jgi:exosortase
LPSTFPPYLTAVKQHRFVFAILIAISIAIAWTPLFHTGLLALEDDEYTHLLLVLPVSISLIFLEQRSSQAESVWGFRLGSLLVGLGVLTALCAHVLLRAMPQDVQLAAQMLALVISWIGVFVLCFGMEASRSALFPLLLLLAFIPLPRLLLDPVISLLQVGSAWSAHLLFAVFGVPVMQSGSYLAIPGLSIQVAQECSSIRSSSMLLLTTIILAQLFLRTFWRKALVAAIALPLSVAKNGLRIFVIAVLGTRVDPGYLTGKFHRQGGILYFILALGFIFAVLWICRRGEAASKTVTWTGGDVPNLGTHA